MLTTRLETVWNAASDAEKLRATDLAKHTLENLTHYTSQTGPKGLRGRPRYYADDVRLLAATLVFFDQTKPKSEPSWEEPS